MRYWRQNACVLVCCELLVMVRLICRVKLRSRKSINEMLSMLQLSADIVTLEMHEV